ncbi:hypothetical protein GF342_01050 [Candidatus Woesearchaeota archaeon]|nr:hypothetical protein [Candidatus Woesearchaeota archaeon]
MVIDLVFVIVGLVGLWIGSDLLIKGVKTIATGFGLSHLFVGLAFVSIGTSIPEIAVSVSGALDRLAGFETSGVVVGNSVGSALNQVCLFMGILAFLVPLYLTRKETMRHGSFLIASALLVFGLAIDGTLSFIDGWIMIAAYITYYLITLLSEKVMKDGRESLDKKLIVKNVFYGIFGLVIVLIMSDIVVRNAVHFAESLGVRQSLVGVLIVGFGTGLPEFSVAIASARQHAMAISMGNLIGSNISDLLLALGSGTVISGFVVDKVLVRFDLPVLIFFCFVVVGFLLTRQRISRLEGTIMILLFAIFTYLKLFVIG